ncbi:hypothetical protein GGR47_002380 [Sphingomonas aquatilis]|uniref:Uncharacterized protein n=2 Tax=Sphingomonas aquatilis TaxID=93063 RepID=A0AAW3TXD0_9SPHN|nr:hypothetical protein [Sphingomonas aquatilis]MBB3876134.1 hypothetical protein [Sphingomonas aquatilis]
MIDAFARSLKVKLARAEAKYGYSDNWRTDDWEADCQCDLAKHVAKGDPLDVAAYAAFCWARGYRTSPVEGLTSGEGEADADLIAGVKRALQNPDGEHDGWTDAGLKDVFFRWPTIVHAINAALATSPKATATASVRECGAAPDHADIMETIENAADDWQTKGYTSALAEVRDMANVGRALMEALPEGYHYMNYPSEIVSDLQNQISDLQTFGITDSGTATASVRERAKDKAIGLIRDLVVELETWEPELLDVLRLTPQAKLLREWIAKPASLTDSGTAATIGGERA